MTTIQDLMPPKLTSETIAGLRVTPPAAEDYINLLVYGEAGVGKTRLTGSAVEVPEMSPVLLIDFEGGTLSLSGDYHRVEVIRVKTMHEMDRLYGSLYDKNPYRTIVLDSLSEAQQFVMRDIMRAVVAQNPDRDPDVASLREWGKNGEQVRRLVRALRDLPCNTLFTALSVDDKDDSGKLLKTRPKLPGQLKSEIAGYVDIVAYMYRKEIGAARDREIKTLLLTQGTEKQVAKDRSGRLPALIEAPTMDKIARHIKYGPELVEAKGH